MRKRMILPLIFGLAGTAILIGLGSWQLSRLAWKEAVLADMRTELAADPVALPDAPTRKADNFRPVKATGNILPGGLRVLTSRRGYGAGFRIISAFQTGNRVILLDRGFIGQARADTELVAAIASVTGNLHWPDETDRTFTPDPDLDRNLWFARDVGMMAGYLGTEPVLLVLRETSETDSPVTPWPVDTTGIANDHLQYAITWFSLAVLWMGMTLYLLWRIRQRTV